MPVILSEGCSRGPIGLCRRVLRLARLITARRIDVVHVLCPISEIAALIATRLARRGKVLGVRRNIGYWHTWRRPLDRPVYVGLLWAPDTAANCPEAAREFAARVESISTGTESPSSVIAVVVERLKEGLAQATRTKPHYRKWRNGDLVVGIVATVRPMGASPHFLPEPPDLCWIRISKDGVCRSVGDPVHELDHTPRVAGRWQADLRG